MSEIVTRSTPLFRRIHEVIDPWVRAQPDAPAIVDARVRLTYAELASAVEATSAQLGELGVRAGDRILLVAENCAALAVLVLAASQCDAWAVVVNARLSPREIDNFIDHSGARRGVFSAQVSSRPGGHPGRGGAPAGETCGQDGTAAACGACKLTKISSRRSRKSRALPGFFAICEELWAMPMKYCRKKDVLMRRPVTLPRFKVLAIALALASATHVAYAQEWQTSSFLMGATKYGENFQHYDYVNPDAPKGGQLNQTVPGTFDSFNPYIVRGTPAAGLALHQPFAFQHPHDAMRGRFWQAK